ncbi:DUF4346 domain-containing protein [Candidatus Woesearchaeota archaeon]|nr:DUF4346 domain-containing protein [Candidatus Woesearchaeota archaeon]
MALPWIKQKTYAKDFKTIQGAFDPYKDWALDQRGYFLIRLNKETKQIEAAHCTNQHIITNVITGKTAQEIYITAIKLGLVGLLEHAAYLGKELKKAEYCLTNNQLYEQE